MGGGFKEREELGYSIMGEGEEGGGGGGGDFMKDGDMCWGGGCGVVGWGFRVGWWGCGWVVGFDGMIGMKEMGEVVVGGGKEKRRGGMYVGRSIVGEDGNEGEGGGNCGVGRVLGCDEWEVDGEMGGVKLVCGCVGGG